MGNLIDRARNRLGALVSRCRILSVFAHRRQRNNLVRFMATLDRTGRICMIEDMTKWESDPGLTWDGQDTHAVLKKINGPRFEAMIRQIEMNAHCDAD